jgi:hypothetical protein
VEDKILMNKTALLIHLNGRRSAILTRTAEATAITPLEWISHHPIDSTALLRKFPLQNIKEFSNISIGLNTTL